MRLSIAALAVSMTMSSVASAQPATDEAMAESLFREAKALMAKDSYAEACPKFAESQRLDPGTGTLLALAFCHEKAGKVASAWAEYTSVLLAADKAGQSERSKVARSRIAALEPLLPHLAVRVPDAMRSVAGFELKRDGIVLGAAAWGTSSPVDPGEHAVDATAPGHKPFHATVTLAPSAAGEIVVTELEREAVIAPPAPTEPPASVPVVGPPREPEPEPDGSGRRTVGYAVGGVGIVGLGIGSIFGISALGKASDANSACPDTRCANADAVRTNDEAKTAATVSTVAFAIGAVAVAAGVYLVLSAPSSKKSATARALAGGFTW
jgi:hypothetical protein